MIVPVTPVSVAVPPVKTGVIVVEVPRTTVLEPRVIELATGKFTTVTVYEPVAELFHKARAA